MKTIIKTDDKLLNILIVKDTLNVQQEKDFAESIHELGRILRKFKIAVILSPSSQRAESLSNAVFVAPEHTEAFDAEIRKIIPNYNKTLENEIEDCNGIVLLTESGDTEDMFGDVYMSIYRAIDSMFFKQHGENYEFPKEIEGFIQDLAYKEVPNVPFLGDRVNPNYKSIS